MNIFFYRSRESLRVSEGETDSAVDVRVVEKDTYKPNLVNALFKAYGFKWGVACSFLVLDDATEFLKPVLLK